MASLTPIPGKTGAEPKLNVVLIHGLAGDPHDSWMANAEDEGTFWPARLAGEVDGLQVWCAGYDSDQSTSGREFRNLGSELLERFTDNRIGELPIVFIAHSCGGLIVKHLLQQAESSSNGRKKKLATNTQGIAFLGTPHRGAVGGMHKDDALHDWFTKDFLASHTIKILSYAETKQTNLRYWGFGPNILVVDALSAFADLPGDTIALKKDHPSLCKPSSENDPPYPGLRDFVKDCRDESAPIASPTPTTPVVSNRPNQRPAGAAYKYDALISYRRQEPDKAFARDLLKRLEAVGLKVAIDERDFDPVETFLGEMERCIKESRFTLAVMSPQYLQSGNCEEEAIICKVLDMSERRRRIIPLTIEAVTMPTWLYNVVGINFTDPNPLVDPHAKLLAKLQNP